MINFKNSLFNIIKFWFGKDKCNTLWFQKNIDKRIKLDKIIKNKFNNILQILEHTNIFTKIDTFNNIEIVAMIVCLDQFSRHIYREDTLYNKNKININTRIALTLSNYLCNTSSILNIPITNVIFVLMPYKHVDLQKYFPKIKQIILKMIDVTNYDNYSENQNLLYKFYQDSLKKFLLGKNNLILTNNTLFCRNDYNCICEYLPLNQVKKITEKNDYLLNICDSFLSLNINLKKITISLSGGPDSMVLTHILNNLKNKYNLELSAFYLNYNNRIETLLEESLIADFCKELKLPLYVHRICHLKRNDNKREFYENLTREIRFKMYKKLGNNIILGHIKDDLIENIWTNFANGRNLFNLKKIEEITVVNGINLLRPLYRTDKKDIYNYAHKHNIPYLKNTTPNWSNRGKLRNRFLPEVDRQFGINTNEKIIYLSDSLNCYKKLLDDTIFIPIINSIQINKNSLYFSIKKFIDMTHHFWNHVFTLIFHKLNLSVPSYKSINHFIQYLKRKENKKIYLTKEVYAIIQNNYVLYLYTKFNI